MRKENEEKMAFWTLFETFKYLIMSFKLMNASVIFQRHITQILSSILEKEVLIYLNNILIVSKIKKENVQKINQIKKLLTEAKLQWKKEKYKYYQKKILFLDFQLKNKKIEKNLKKVKIITN